ncbi:hypothetical protein D3C73_1340040 [compost metagenome]
MAVHASVRSPPSWFCWVAREPGEPAAEGSTPAGSPVRCGPLWIPVRRWVAGSRVTLKVGWTRSRRAAVSRAISAVTEGSR